MKRLLLPILLLLGLIAPAFAQTAPNPAAYTGTELLRLQTNAGSFGQVTINHVRNTQGYLLVPTGTTVVSTPTWYQAVVMATGAITTWTVNLPNPAPDGMTFTVANTTNAAFTTNTTVQTQTGVQTQTLAQAFTAQTLAANSSATWIFTATAPTTVGLPVTAGTWNRVR